MESVPIRRTHAKVWANEVLFFKLVWRGIRDLFDQFMIHILFSMLWWLSVVLIVPAPPATSIAIFHGRSSASERRA